MTTSTARGQRLLRPEADVRRRHQHGAAIALAVAASAAAGVLGALPAAIVYLAAGAGAGYSLSGSV